MKSCVVVFPLYQSPTPTELAFLEHGLELTKDFKQVIVAPEGLTIDNSFGKLAALEVKRFAKHYFESISGYNQLLLSTNFYTTFQLFDYILIHQADVYLFRNELQFWCDKDYDYIGAPWYRPDKLNNSLFISAWQRLKLIFRRNKVYAKRHNKSGNGGLSLRKVSKALEVLNKVDQAVLKKYTRMNDPSYNEDIFWSLIAPTVIPDFNIPEWPEALQFAVEFNPHQAYLHLNKKLPFGCHAPLKNIEFWKDFIPEIHA